MTIIDFFKKHIGAREYEGIVAAIQKWFYGSLQRSAWCATSESYAADQAGVLDQLGGKKEGVWEMYGACKAAHANGHRTGGRFYDYGSIPETIPEGAVLFFLRSGASHVTNAYESKKYDRQGYIACLGGNQDDAIKVKNYHMQKLQAVFVPDYKALKRPTIKRGYKDSERGGRYCVTVQKALNMLINAGLALDGSCGPATEAAIKDFQNAMKNKGAYDSTVDGSFGPRSWATLDDLSPIVADGYLYNPGPDSWTK